MFHCNHDRDSTDYVKVMGFLGMLFFFQVGQDHVSSTLPYSSRKLLKDICTVCSCVGAYLMYRGLGAFLSRSNPFVPRMFRASHNENQFDTLKLVGECGRHLLSSRIFFTTLYMCVNYQRSGTAQIPSYSGDLCLQLGLLCLSRRLALKGVSMCVSDDRLLPDFQVLRH
ncbi:MAG: hypothetical protein CL816_05880 [Coxiellaceae bacterium]|nr:hypothetical protein [Coxiellaceae bacterium]